MYKNIQTDLKFNSFLSHSFHTLAVESLCMQTYLLNTKNQTLCKDYYI